MTQDRPAPSELAAVLERLVAADKSAFVWLDDKLIVTRTFGRLADRVEVGAHVSSGLVALIGQERRIEALIGTDGGRFDLPNVAMIVSADAPAERVDLTVMNHASTGLIVAIERVVSAGLAELVVEDQIRKRRIADAELARINRQLSEFTYVISHDLNAPLRALRYFSGDVAEALEAEPPDLDAARTAAANITTATRRMSSMLTGLLEYSRVGHATEPLETVDTQGLVAAIASAMPLGTGLKLSIEGQWPTMRAAVTPLDLVLRNLIDNAVKYHDRSDGRIRVIARDAPGHLVVDVVDDGPGIPKEWHQAIFDPFKRIDDEASPESSGLGLALVKRTLEAEGGKIEVISDPPTTRGTTFRVTWPKR